MNAQLAFDFEIGHYNGTMGMSIWNDQQELFSVDHFVDKKFSYVTSIALPGRIHIKTNNKGQWDTDVNNQGQIVQDKYIKIVNVTVDRMPVHILTLLNMIKFDTGTQILTTNYLGFNGCATIDFCAENSLLWHLQQISQH
jgi:hypothetical protein